jgi:hypothetical protein
MHCILAYILIFVIPSFAMNNDAEYNAQLSLLGGWHLAIDNFSNPLLIEQFKQDIQSLSLLGILKQESHFLNNQYDIDHLPKINSFSQNLFIDRTKQWCSIALPIIQDAKKSKIHRYLLGSIMLVGFCGTFCACCAWYKYRKEKLQLRSNTQW